MNVWPCGPLPEENGPMRPLWPAGRLARRPMAGTGKPKKNTLADAVRRMLCQITRFVTECSTADVFTYFLKTLYSPRECYWRSASLYHTSPVSHLHCVTPSLRMTTTSSATMPRNDYYLVWHRRPEH